MQKSSRKLITSTAAAVALLAALPLAGCSAFANAPRGYLVFDDKNEAVSDGGTDIPAWLPDDATSIAVDYPAHSSGYLMKFSSATGVPVSATCTAGPEGVPLTPTISADWWPKQPLTDDRRRCGTAEAARIGQEWYVWGK